MDLPSPSPSPPCCASTTFPRPWVPHNLRPRELDRRNAVDVARSSNDFPICRFVLPLAYSAMLE